MLRSGRGLGGLLCLVCTLSCSDVTPPWESRRANLGDDASTDASSDASTDAPPFDAGPPPTAVVLASDDTYVGEWPDNNVNHAAESLLSLQGSPQVMRPLLRFDVEQIRTAVAGREVIAARIGLTVQANNGAWCWGEPSCADRQLEVHRVKQGYQTSGATWECALDSNVSNNDLDCAWFSGAHWFMGWPAGWPFIEVATGDSNVGMTTSGVVALDVTSDVRAMLSGVVANEGWIVKLSPWSEGKPGRLDFASLRG